MRYLTFDYEKMNEKIKKLSDTFDLNYKDKGQIRIEDILSILNPLMELLPHHQFHFKKSTLEQFKHIVDDTIYKEEPSINHRLEKPYLTEETNIVEEDIDYMIDQLSKDLLQMIIDYRNIDNILELDPYLYHINKINHRVYYPLIASNISKSSIHAGAILY